MKPAPSGLLPLFEITDIAKYGLTWNSMEINGKLPHYSKIFYFALFFLYIVDKHKF